MSNCPVCGSEVLIGGDKEEGTHYYIPVAKKVILGRLKKMLEGEIGVLWSEVKRLIYDLEGMAQK